jgi:hypothetical protein
VLSVPHAGTVLPHHPRVTQVATLEGIDLAFIRAL